MDRAGLERQLLRFRGRFARKKLAPWDYFDSEQGSECILLLPGSLVTGESYFPFVDAFPPRWRVLAPGIPAVVTTIGETLSGLVAILDREGIAQTHVFGHSQGGMVAQCLVRKAPERIATLMLSSTLIPSQASAEAEEKALLRARVPPEWFIRAYLRWRSRSTMRFDAPELSASERCFFADYVASPGIKPRAISSALVQLDYHRSFHFSTHDLEGWPGRTLIAACENDRVVTRADFNEMSAMYPGAARHVFPNAGHMSMLGRVQDYASLIAGFAAGAYNVLGDSKTFLAP